MNHITQQLLQIVSDLPDNFRGAFNIREDGQCAARQSSENILIESKKDAPGLVIHIKPGTKGETVYIPACVTHGGVIMNMLARHALPQRRPEDWMTDPGAGYSVRLDTAMWMRDHLAEAYDIVPAGYLDGMEEAQG